MNTDTHRVQVTLSSSCKEIVKICSGRVGENMSEFYKKACVERILRLVKTDPLLREKLLLVESTCLGTDQLQHILRNEEV